MATLIIPVSIPLFYDRPEVFEKKHEIKFFREITAAGGRWEEQPRDIQQSLRLHFNGRYPLLHKYNNVLGHVEIEIEGKDILLYYFMNGDRRKKYNKWLKYRNGKIAIYPATGHEWAASFTNRSNDEIRKALVDGLQQVVERCHEWKVYVNITEASKMIKHFDFESWMGESE